MQFFRAGQHVLRLSHGNVSIKQLPQASYFLKSHQKVTSLLALNQYRQSKISWPPQSRFIHKTTNKKHSTIPQRPNTNPKLPDLLYFPHILRWLKSKLQFKVLQKTWDPDFSEGAFIYGTTHAVCRITEIINENKVLDLQTLVTPQVEAKLKDVVITKLTPLQKEMIRLRPDDIKLLVPLWVKFDTENGRKMCKILLKSLSLKWFEYAKSLKLVLIVLETEFQRDYGLSSLSSEWTISNFDVTQCSVLTSAPS